ncbi:MAG: lactate utilization protein, partial [Clostridia bacterium]|nr:lactate utilization protein [Clostridia bacterium]
PKHVLVVVGKNKIVKTAEDAVRRVRELAAPRNAMRFAIRTPCKVTQKCEDCLCPDSICKSFVRTRLVQKGRVFVILVDEDLGY